MRTAFLTALTLLAVSSSFAQTVPAYIGQLLLQPGRTSTQCLTAASNSDGAQVTIQPCTGSDSQKWTFTGGSVKIFGNKCLDVPSGNTANGVKVQIWTCFSGNTNQQWQYSVWTNQLTWTNRGKCLDLTDGNTASGTRIQTWGCNPSSDPNINQVWDAGYMYNQLPNQSQNGQFGTNNCGTGSPSSSNCQTSWLNSATDFCLFAPPTLATVGDAEREAISYCTKSGRGARVIPNGTLKGVHFVRTPEYVQITGIGDFTKLNIPKGDSGGELDNRGADGRGNPIGGLIYGNTFAPNLQYHEWTEFISDTEFCIRACIGPRATQLCNHIYDEMGCYWNMPANYNPGFEECDGDAATPMGVYGTSTWHQGVSPTPPPHPAPASSNCKSLPTVTSSPLRRSLSEGERMVKRAPAPAFPGATPAPL